MSGTCFWGGLFRKRKQIYTKPRNFGCSKSWFGLNKIPPERNGSRRPHHICSCFAPVLSGLVRWIQNDFPWTAINIFFKATYVVARDFQTQSNNITRLKEVEANLMDTQGITMHKHISIYIYIWVRVARSWPPPPPPTPMVWSPTIPRPVPHSTSSNSSSTSTSTT